MHLTDLEIAALNPHGLAKGDRVILPDGNTDTIEKLGLKWGVLATYAPIPLTRLRPWQPPPQIQQLSLID